MLVLALGYGGYLLKVGIGNCTKSITAKSPEDWLWGRT